MRRPFLRLVALVARRDYVRTVRRRGFVAGTLLLPLAMGVIVGISALASAAAAGGDGGPVVVVNESATPLTPDPQLTPHIQVVDRAQADRLLSTGAISSYFVVPGTWPANPQVLSVQKSRLGGASPLQMLAGASAGQSEVDLLLRVSILREAGLPDTALIQLLMPIQLTAVDESGAPVSEASVVASFFIPIAFTLIFILSLFITSGYLLQSVTEERENRVVEIVISSVKALPLMAGKILGLGAAGLTQVAIWVAAALLTLPLLNKQFSLNVAISPVTLILALAVFLLGYLGYGAIFAAVGAVAPGARESQQYGSFFGFVAVIPLILLSLFLSDPNSPIVVALCLLPLTAPAALLEVLAISGSPPWPLVVASLISQVLFVAITVIASARIFRATVLLYGTRPSVGRLVDAVLARG